MLPGARSPELGELVDPDKSGDVSRGEVTKRPSRDGDGPIVLAASVWPGWISGALELDIAAGVGLIVAVAMVVDDEWDKIIRVGAAVRSEGPVRSEDPEILNAK